MTIAAPFRFSRIGRRVYFPEWAELVSHDIPLKDACCGEIDIRLVAQTPLLVGGKRRAGSDEEAGEVWPFELSEGRYAIPNSSLQGMVRSILEIGSFAQLGRFIDRKRFGIRDLLAGTKPIYQDQMADSHKQTVDGRDVICVDPRVRGGWLRRTENGYEFKKCEISRIDYQELEAITDVKATSLPNRYDYENDRKFKDAWERACRSIRSMDWRSKSNIEDRYGWIVAKGKSLKQNLMVDEEEHYHWHRKKSLRIKYKQAITGTVGTGKTLIEGNLVLSGNASKPAFRKPGSASKHMEFFFFNEQPVEQLTDFQPKFDEFLSIHEPDDGRAENENWEYYKSTGYPQQNAFLGEPGGWMPIFYLPGDDEVIDTFGLAFNFKKAHKNDTHDLLANSSPDHLENDDPKNMRLDLPSLIFGLKADLESGSGVKRRATFDFAEGRLPDGDEMRRTSQPTVLLSPKPNYYPIYVRQPCAEGSDRLPGGGPYASYTELAGENLLAEHSHPELAGVKIWPAKGASAFPRLSDDLNHVGNKIQIHLNALPAGTVFQTKLRFHNIRRVELGAVLWALTFGDADALSGKPGTYNHRLGMGKPYHLGEVKIAIGSARIEPNDASLPEDRRIAKDDWSPLALVNCFKAHMQQVYQGMEADSKWLESKQVKALIKAADPSRNTAGNLNYMPLKNDGGGQDGTYLGEKKASRVLNDFVEGHEFARSIGTNTGDWQPAIGDLVLFGPADGAGVPGRIVELPKDVKTPYWKVDFGDGKKPKSIPRSLMRKKH